MLELPAGFERRIGYNRNHKVNYDRPAVLIELAPNDVVPEVHVKRMGTKRFVVAQGLHSPTGGYMKAEVGSWTDHDGCVCGGLRLVTDAAMTLNLWKSK